MLAFISLSPTDEAAIWLLETGKAPGERHWEILAGLMTSGQATGSLVMDAALAALAIEHGLTLRTTDRAFRRFPGLSFAIPLS